MNDDYERLDEFLGPAADEIVALAGALARLGLIDSEHLGRYRHTVLGNGEQVVSWEVEQPEPRRYAFHPGTDTIVATRMREDERYEHAVLDENGMPLKWRTARRPDLN